MPDTNNQNRAAIHYAEASAFFSAAAKAFSLASANRKSEPDRAAEARGVARFYMARAEAAEGQAAALAAAADDAPRLPRGTDPS